MTEHEQIAHLSNDLDALIERYRKEYNMAYASVSGTLMMKIHLLCMEDTVEVEEE